jgi:hypothetical protein
MWVDRPDPEAPNLSEFAPVKTTDASPARDPTRGSPRELLLRVVLPRPVSAVRGLMVLLSGFALEGATEVYQFLSRGDLAHGPVEYYTTLATTLFGFYLMFLGLREWHVYFPRERPRGVGGTGRPWPRTGVALWAGGTAATAVASLALRAGSSAPSPVWIAWPVGGIVVLTFGGFFLGLRKEAVRLGSPVADILGWSAFLWSLGVATIAGLVIGDLALPLLYQFVTNWGALIASIAPIVVAMSPLYVTYALLIGAFVPSLVRTRREGN